MDNGGGGCCIARYGGAGGGYDISTIDRIMMKFRPIAPKPAHGASSSPEMSENSVNSGRGRRLNGNGNRRCNDGSNNRKRKALTAAAAAAAVVTLPLLPEAPDRKNITPTKESSVAVAAGITKKLPIWLSFGSKDEMTLLDRTVVATPQVVPMTTVGISSCVTVECVTDTWVDDDGLGCTDGERRMNLERDRCPGFISDGFGRVTWTNDAYRKMATEGVEDGKVEVLVRLAVKDTAAVMAALGSNTAFTCRVRVQNQRSGGNGKERSSVTLPCDVWRMDRGFAWRLDVAAALSLGR